MLADTISLTTPINGVLVILRQLSRRKLDLRFKAHRNSLASFCRWLKSPRSHCPSREFRTAYGSCHSLQRSAKLKQFAALLESGERDSSMRARAREHSSDTDFKAQRICSVQPGGFGFFRQPAFRSGGATHRPAAPPRWTPRPAAESLVAPVSLSPTKDVSSIGDSSRNRN